MNLQIRSLKYIAPIGVSNDTLTIKVAAQNGYVETFSALINVTEPNINPVALTAGYVSFTLSNLLHF